MIGSTVGHYRITSRLGEGGMGVVYRADDLRLHRPVALKMLVPAMAANVELRARFLREARAAAALNHPNICTIYDISESEGFIAMECVEGPSLKQHLAGGPLPWRQSVEIALQLAAGLGVAHERGIVHRDIKPANILLNAQGIAKITDFGLAVIAGDVEITLPGQLLGTPAYMSPEQTRGERVDHRTDIWSFGVVLFEMATGQKPFASDNLASLLRQIEAAEPRAASNVRPELPASIDSVIARALARNPDARFQSIQQAADILRSLLADPGLASSTGSVTMTATCAAQSPGDDTSVAIADFENRTNDPSFDWLSGAIAETLAKDLKRIVTLRVLDRRQVLHEGPNQTARWRVGGQFTKSDDRFTITGAISGSLAGRTVSAPRVEGRLDEVFTMLATLAREVARSLDQSSGNLSGAQPGTSKLDALKLYARGRRHFYQFDSAGFEQAQHLFEQALAVDPDYALAWAGVGSLFVFRFVRSTRAEDLQAGIERLERAVALDAEIADAYQWLCYGYSRQNKYEEAVRAADKSIEIEPLNYLGYYFLGAAHCGQACREHAQHLFDSARNALEKCVRIEPNYQPGHMLLGWQLMLRGENDRAAVHLLRAVEIEQSGRFEAIKMVGALTLFGLLRQRQGLGGEAEQWYRRSLECLAGKPHHYRDQFTVFALCGLADAELTRRQPDVALEELARAEEIIAAHPDGIGMGYCRLRTEAASARALHRLGLAKLARDRLDQALLLLETRQTGDFSWIWDGCDARACYDIARTYATMHRPDEARRWLDRAAEAGWSNRTELDNDDAMASLRSAEQPCQ